MAFLDNSGDIILDAVLTDTGRFRLAKGDGSFKIVKFALADDEINYGLYDKNDPSGSAYYDLEILQTPVMEAFTNNTSTMNYKLLSIPRTNLLYLAILKINNVATNDSCKVNSGNQGYVVCVTDDTWNAMATNQQGGWNGETITDSNNMIRVDQGIDNSAVSWKFDLDQDLKETQYIIGIDSRIGIMASVEGQKSDATISFIDDDSIASYYISATDGNGFVENIKGNNARGYISNSTVNTLPAQLTIAGAQGTTLRFVLKSTIELQSSDYLFDTIGSTFGVASATAFGFDSTKFTTLKYIDTVVKITGATTGYRLDLPVRFVKKTA